MNRFIKYTGVFCLYLLIGVFSKTSYAADTPKGMFSVSPVIFNISLSPGKTFTYQIRLKNLLSSPLPMRAEMDPAVDGEAADGATSIAGWTTISDADMIIPAHGEKTIQLHIQTPTKIPLGGYYGTLFLQPVMPMNAGVNQYVQARAGVVILASVGVPDLSARAEVLSVGLAKSSSGSNKRDLTFAVKDQSLYHFSAKPQLVVKPLIGSVRKFDINEKIILPGKTRTWEEAIRWPYHTMNIYDVKLLVSVGNGNQIVAATRYYDIPYPLVAFIVIVTVGLILAYKKRSNLKRALRVLILNK
ncbi:hypothetical protein HYS00_03535 [Candidatus Microgenomates bacterium]|nr:hypothetical protein [Candidatus Microgenomates bacterium]